MSRLISPWIPGLMATAVAVGLASGCQLLDPRLSCTVDTDCGIGVCNGGFCDDPPLPAVTAPSDADDDDEPFPEAALTCEGDLADFSWRPVGELNGGVAARLIRHGPDALIVGGDSIHSLDLAAGALAPVTSLTRRHDAAGLASDGARLVVAGGEDLRGLGTIFEVLNGDTLATTEPSGLEDAPLDQVAFLPGGDLIVAHRDSGLSARVEFNGSTGGQVTPMASIAGRRIIQITGGVLAVGRGAIGEPLLRFAGDDDDDWVSFADLDDDGLPWTDMAVARHETPSGELIFLAGGLLGGALTPRVVRVNPRAEPPTVETLPDLPTPRRAPTAVVMADGALVVIGGFAGPRVPLAPVERLQDDSWTSLPGIPGSVTGSTSLTLDDCIATVDANGAPALWVFAREDGS